MRMLQCLPACVGLLAVLARPPLAAQAPIGHQPTCRLDDSRTPVLIVGTIHWANPGLDAFNPAADDVLTPGRQAEVEEVVDRLATFRPTRVLVESPPREAAQLAVRFARYRATDTGLTRNEIDQLGFRLAKRAGAAVHGVDERIGLDMGALQRGVEDDSAASGYLAALGAFAQEAVAALTKVWQARTIRDALLWMNDPAIVRAANVPYVGFMAPIGAGEGWEGADLAAEWYRRNLRIFARVARYAGPGERLVVIFGQGHAPLLADFVGTSRDLCLLPLSEVL